MGAEFHRMRKRTKDTENLRLAAETNTVPKTFLFQNVSLFIYSFLYSIIRSFKQCLLSIYSEPRTLLGTGKPNSKATWTRTGLSAKNVLSSLLLYKQQLDSPVQP